jgi:Holliday junction resolvasome RuvABC endonuclease subunit
MVVGIDASLTHCAVVMGRAEVHDPSAVMVFGSEPSGKALMPRLLRYDKLIASVMSAIAAGAASLKSPPTLVCLEGYSLGSQGDAVMQLAEFGGLLRMALTKKTRVLEVTPSQVKKFAQNGRGVGSKLDVSMAMFKAFGWEYSGDGAEDRYDASACYAIASGIACPSYAEQLTKARQEVLAEVCAGPKPKTKGKKRGARG